MSTDVLSDVLRAVRLTGAMYFSVKAAEPWAAEAFPAAEVVSRVMPEVGYASEAAFSRAFKKVVGVSPAAWRERGASPDGTRAEQ